MNFKIKDDILMIVFPPIYAVTELAEFCYRISIPGEYTTILTQNLCHQSWIEKFHTVIPGGNDYCVHTSTFVEAEQAQIALSRICEYVLASNHQGWLNNASESEIAKWVSLTFGDDI